MHQEKVFVVFDAAFEKDSEGGAAVLEDYGACALSTADQHHTLGFV